MGLGVRRDDDNPVASVKTSAQGATDTAPACGTMGPGFRRDDELAKPSHR